MNKKTFLRDLRSSLQRLPKSEQDEILYDYEEHFQIGIENGETEESIALSLGLPSNIAKQYNAEYSIRRAETSESAPNILRAIFASIGLGLFNLIIVLAPFVAIIAILIALFAVSIALTLGGFFLLISSILGPISSQYSNIPPELFSNPIAVGSFGIGVICIGILLFIGNMMIGKGIYKISVRYLKYNLSIIQNKGAIKWIH